MRLACETCKDVLADGWKTVSLIRIGHQLRHCTTTEGHNLCRRNVRWSWVSKATEKKAPRCRRQSEDLAEHGYGQNQGPNTTISPLLLANIALRRSSRLSNNGKRSGALEANLSVNLGQSARPPIIPRRSDRISKQKEKTSLSASSAAVNSAVILKTDPLRRLSRSKSAAADRTSLGQRGEGIRHLIGRVKLCSRMSSPGIETILKLASDYFLSGSSIDIP